MLLVQPSAGHMQNAQWVRHMGWSVGRRVIEGTSGRRKRPACASSAQTCCELLFGDLRWMHESIRAVSFVVKTREKGCKPSCHHLR